MANNSLSPNNIIALTVTYGQRIALVEKCVEALQLLSIPHLVLVTNGIAKTYLTQLQELQFRAKIKIELVELDKNIGAGGGFAAGIKYARLKYGEKFLWFLDDDNCPREDAIKALSRASSDIDPIKNLIAFTSLRGDRFPLWLIAAKSGNGEGVFYRKSSISSLDFRRIPIWLWKRLRKTPSSIPKMGEMDSSTTPVRVDIPGGPYGGFLIYSKHIDVIGYPEEKFVLYFDDLEWTNRVRRNGGHVFLVPGCIVDDAEGDWAVTENNGAESNFFMVNLIKSSSTKRLFFSIRNNIYFKSRFWNDNWLIMGLNITLFLILAIALGILLRKPKNAWTMIHAAFNGTLGRLGGHL